MEIIESEDFRKVLAEGKATDQECAEAWEQIVRKNYELNGGFDYINYIDVAKGYANLISEHNLVNSLLLKLVILNLEIGLDPFDEIFVQDDEVIKELAEYGFIINTSGKKEFVESLNACIIRVKSFNTRITMKAKELVSMFEGKESKRINFDELMAMLMVQNITVSDDITLSRYNELIKILNERNQKLAA